MKTEPTEALSIKRANFVDKYLPPGDEQRYYDRLKMHEELFDLTNSHSQKIKQLEWEDTNMWYFESKTSLGLWYSITELKGTYIVHFGYAPISWEKSLESAKAAAQRDFEQKVKECLE